jgi:hypothetical protein
MAGLSAASCHDASSVAFTGARDSAMSGLKYCRDRSCVGGGAWNRSDRSSRRRLRPALRFVRWRGSGMSLLGRFIDGGVNCGIWQRGVYRGRRRNGAEPEGSSWRRGCGDRVWR